MGARLFVLLKTLGFLSIGLLLAAFAGELVVRLGAADQNKYVIEMWRYARELKVPSDDPAVGHEHVANHSAQLQGVEIATNSLGLRGPELLPREAGRHRVVIIGDSLALGWGVSDEESLRGQLAQRLGDGYEVLNTGVANMNLEQVVARWLKVGRDVEADTVVLFSSLRAAGERPKGEANWLLRHSQMAAMGAVLWEQWQAGRMDRKTRVAALRERWSSEAGRGVIDRAMDRLKQDQEARGYRVIVAQMPEPHDFVTYEFGFMAEVMEDAVRAHGWAYLDLFPLFKGKEASDFWASSDDLHPNRLALSLIADDLAPRLQQ